MRIEKLKVLKACKEKPGTVPQIAKEMRINEDHVESILRGLKKEGLVYKEDKIWLATLKGAEKLNEKNQ